MPHSPGPWKCEGDDFGDGPAVAIVDAGGGLVAVVDLVTPERDRTDARLIAAAPELLEALRAVVTMWPWKGADEPVERARALIARIDGEGPAWTLVEVDAAIAADAEMRKKHGK